MLSERQRLVLSAVITAYVGEAAPIGSKSIAQVLSTPISSATIRATLAELAELDEQMERLAAMKVLLREGLDCECLRLADCTVLIAPTSPEPPT